jgi:hypothetical protein
MSTRLSRKNVAGTYKLLRKLVGGVWKLARGCCHCADDTGGGGGGCPLTEPATAYTSLVAPVHFKIRETDGGGACGPDILVECDTFMTFVKVGTGFALDDVTSVCDFFLPGDPDPHPLGFDSGTLLWHSDGVTCYWEATFVDGICSMTWRRYDTNPAGAYTLNSSNVPTDPGPGLSCSCVCCKTWYDTFDSLVLG